MRLKGPCLIVLLAALQGASAQQDTLELPEATVGPWPRAQDRHALAAYTTLDSSTLSNTDRSALRTAAQWTPGVQWDQRGLGGSQRLGIRGSLLRSPYGVRGVKVYWGPFPLTLADGSTPLELLDPMLAGSVDVVRSVGSPIYGSAPSGLLLVNAPFRRDTGTDAQVEALGGMYGHFRLQAVTRSNTGKAALTTGLVRQRSDGYREQEWSARDQAFLAARWVHKQGFSQAFVTYQDAAWALPGSLDSATAATSPRSARPYSQLINAHVKKQQLFGGVATDLRVGEHLRWRAGLHAQLIDKLNPYGTSAFVSGEKNEDIAAAGGRFALAGDGNWMRLPVAWEAGLEALFERDQLVEHAFTDGIIGPLRTDADTRVADLNAFVNSTTRIAANTTFHLGLGVERTRYQHTDRQLNTTATLQDHSHAYPVLGVEHRGPRGLRYHVRYTEAVSRTTIWELLGSTGIPNAELRPEQVREVEAGVNAANAQIMGEAVIYFRRTEGLVIERTLADGENTAFANMGRADLSGLELSARHLFLINAALRATTQAFLDLRSPDLELPDGEHIRTPGIPAWRAGLLIRVEDGRRVRLEAGYQRCAATPAANTGAREVPGYGLLQGRLSYSFRWSGMHVQLFAQGDNLLDASYTAWVQINDPGGRYYNPAPGRVLLGGLRLTFGQD